MNISEKLSWTDKSVSLLTGTLSTTESITPLNPKINLGKYEHPYQVGDLNLHKKLNQLIYNQLAYVYLLTGTKPAVGLAPYRCWVNGAPSAFLLILDTNL